MNTTNSLRSCPEFEKMLIRSGIILIKYWFSVSDEEQDKRFLDRINDPTKAWKLSPMDLESRNRWVAYSRAKDIMFAYTDTKQSPLVCCQFRYQEARAPQLHQPFAQHDPLRGDSAPVAQAGTTQDRRSLHSPRQSPIRLLSPTSAVFPAERISAQPHRHVRRERISGRRRSRP